MRRERGGKAEDGTTERGKEADGTTEQGREEDIRVASRCMEKDTMAEAGRVERAGARARGRKG